LESGEDPDSFVQKFGIDELNKRIESAQTLFDYKVNALMQKHDRKTAEGKARISAEMLTTIAKYKNEVLKQEYLRELAQVLGIAQEALNIELKKMNATPASSGESPVVLKQARNIVRAVERDLLRLMLEEQDIIPLVESDIILEDFQDVQVRSVVEYVFGLSKKGEGINIPRLVQCFNDQETLRFLSELMTAGELIVQDKELLRQGYVNRIKSDRVKFERKNLCYEIQRAESEGNQKYLDELKEKFNQLMKG
jgi:DNA primase